MTNNIPIQLQRTLMQLDEIQAYVESLAGTQFMEDHRLRNMKILVGDLRAQCKWVGGHPMYDSVKQHFAQDNAPFSYVEERE
jgi:hypothetical protein